MRLPNLLATPRGRLAAFFLLYVTEGIPLGFAAVAVVTQLRRADVGPAAIGALVGSLYLPWAFKWAFGPIIDVFASERFGRRRGWIILTQVLMAATLLSTGLLDLPAQLALFTTILLVHNTFGAMQDVAIDALACNALAENERGLANGLMFAGASIGQAIGGAGVLFLAGWVGFQSTFVFVAAAILAVTVFVVLPMREPAAPPRALLAGAARWRAAAAEMRVFAVDAFKSFLQTRGAFVALAFALLPSGAMSLGLALQSNLAVELGLNDSAVARMSLVTSVIGALFMIIGGMLSDRFGRRRTLVGYIALMSLPALYLAWVLQQHGWVMPVSTTAANRPMPPEALVAALWAAVLAYAVAQGLMYGTRSAIFMDVTNPRVAGTQFTAYMALLNLNIAYSATWIGISTEAQGYPRTLVFDAIFGLACLALIAWVRPVAGNAADGGAPARARIAAAALALGCLLWLPYRLMPGALGAAAAVAETFFTVVFVGSAVFLLATSAVPGAAARALVRAGLVLAPLLLMMYGRKWLEPTLQATGSTGGVASAGLQVALLAVPVLAAALLLALAAQGWAALRAESDELATAH